MSTYSEKHLKYYTENRDKVLARLARKQASMPYRMGRLVSGAKARSVSKKVPFDLDNQFLIDLWNKQEGKCPISGRSFDLENSEYKSNPNAPSLDRIVPEKGYIKGNVRLVTWHVNMAISEFGEDALRLLCKDILNKEEYVK